jgi:gluconate 2-dehydrogenase alpha chain
MSEHADVIVIGLGWAGSVIATELALAGRKVIALERGANFEPGADGLGGAVDRREFLARHTVPVDRETFTVRHHESLPSLPMRTMGVFLAGEGVGGAGVLWGGNSPRLSEGAFRARTLARGELAGELDNGRSLLQDWPFDFHDLEADYASFERAIGVAGHAGNIGGTLTGEGNALEGARSEPYPVRAPDLERRSQLVADAARSIGLHPYPYPSADLTTSYTNQYGITRGPSVAGGRQVATPLNSLLPAALASGNLTVRSDSRVVRLVRGGARITSVVYVDGTGEHELSGDAVVLSAWGLNNVRLLLLSGIGEPYDPVTGTGVVGRNYGNHFRTGVTAFFDDYSTAEDATGPTSGLALSDFDPHGWQQGDPYLGGALLAHYGRRFSSGHRAAAPDDQPGWGADWVRGLHRYADNAASVYVQGEVVPQRDRYLDLDPVYRDRSGDPLLRINFNWGENERRMTADIGQRVTDVFKTVGATHINAPLALPDYYDTIEYQNSHATGGAIAGIDPQTSVVDSELRSWETENLWVVGASAFPNAGAANPTVTVGALAYRAARSIGEST